MLEFDHIAIAAETLEEGASWVQEKLGVEIPFGGKHPLMGTHNHVMQLGDAAFLEVIAIDPTASVTRPRWFDLDNFKGPPRIQTWIARQVSGAELPVPVDVGPAIDVTRGEMFWKLTVREDGTLPYGGLFPTVINWPDGQFPVPRMADRGCSLKRLELAHPENDDLRKDLSLVLKDPRVDVVAADRVGMRAEVKTPHGVRVLA